MLDEEYTAPAGDSVVNFGAGKNEVPKTLLSKAKVEESPLPGFKAALEELRSAGIHAPDIVSKSAA